jgi:hypothetical protein
MIEFGTEPIELKTIDIQHSCSSCGYNHQKIHIYRVFFSLFHIPVIPLHKSAIVSCLRCGKQHDKEELVEELLSDGKNAKEVEVHLKAIIKETKVPFYTYVTTGLAFTFVIWLIASNYYEEHQSSIQLASYAQKPIDNVLVVFKADHAFPYHIMYIPQIVDGEAVIFEWKYAYRSLEDAKKEMAKVTISISTTVKNNFYEPILVPLDAFLDSKFVHINPLPVTIDWKELIQ